MEKFKLAKFRFDTAAQEKIILPPLLYFYLPGAWEERNRKRQEKILQPTG